MEEQKYLIRIPNHLANLNNMRLSGKLCDVNDKEFRAHRNILAARLKYFDSMFSSCFQECKQDIITMQDVKEEDIEAVLSFAYTGEILITDNNALNLLKFANYLTEDVIKEACINFLVKPLKTEDACWAYSLANVVGSVSLKNKSRSIILYYFKYCSQTAEYCDIDCDSLKHILSRADLVFCEKQKLVFEGAMRWVMYDVKNRRIFIKDLLKILQITNWNTDFLLEYLCTYAEIEHYKDIIKDIMSFYRQRKQEMNQPENKQNLVIMGKVDEKLEVQFYDFAKEKWYPPFNIVDCIYQELLHSWTFLNHKFYYTLMTEAGNIELHVFDPACKKNMIRSCDRRLLSHSALCACSRYVYLCGGEENGELSNQVLKYDPQTNYFEAVSPMSVKRSYATAVSYQDHIYVLGGRDTCPYNTNMVEKYDPNTNEWIYMPSMSEDRRLHAVAQLHGNLYACGGYYDNSVELYDPSVKMWCKVARMEKARHDFLVVPHEGKLLAIGGDDENTIEVYDPCKDEWKIDPEMSLDLQINCIGGGLIPSNYIE